MNIIYEKLSTMCMYNLSKFNYESDSLSPKLVTKINNDNDQKFCVKETLMETFLKTATLNTEKGIEHQNT